MDIGYARVSTGEQTLDLQLDALKTAGCGKVYQETASGAKAERPVLEEVLAYLRKGDTLVVWRLDRLGRSLKHLIEVVAALAERGIGFKSPDRADRHHHPRRQADLPRLRGPGRVRARPDPGADPRRARRGACPGTAGRAAEETGRCQATGAGADALRGGADRHCHDLRDAGHLPRDALPVSQGTPGGAFHLVIGEGPPSTPRSPWSP